MPATTPRPPSPEQVAAFDRNAWPRSIGIPGRNRRNPQITGDGDLWVTEFVLSYDGVPSYTVSIMEFSGGKVARETQYFGDPFEPGPSRAHLVEPNG